MEQRICKKCNISKFLHDFPTRKKNGKVYYQHTCKACRALDRVNKRKDPKIADRERSLAKARYKKNKKEVLVKNKEWRDSEAGIKNRMIQRSKHRAKTKGFNHNITEDDIIIPAVCPVLGIPFKSGNSKDYLNTPSLDRIDSKKGYEKGNVHVISMKANSMKNCATREELVKFAEWVLDYFNDDIVRTACIEEDAEIEDKELL